jgi:hypothetical protein
MGFLAKEIFGIPGSQIEIKPVFLSCWGLDSSKTLSLASGEHGLDY